MSPKKDFFVYLKKPFHLENLNRISKYDNKSLHSFLGKKINYVKLRLPKLKIQCCTINKKIKFKLSCKLRIYFKLKTEELLSDYLFFTYPLLYRRHFISCVLNTISISPYFNIRFREG